MAGAVILVVDDEPANCVLLARLLQRHGYVVESVGDGESALAWIDERLPDLVLLDVVLPGIDGFQVCRRLKDRPATALLPVVLITGLDAASHKLQGIVAGADDFVSKPFDMVELAARVASLIRLKRYTDDLESAESVILSLALTVEARDPYTEGHCQRLAAYSVALGNELGLAADESAALRRGGYLHDVGKIAIPDAILLKPGPLTPSEFQTITTHTTVGERLCGDLRSLKSVRAIVRHHHERLDGSGYPDGLRGDAIPLMAQIVAIVDAYDAMTTSRPYRTGLPVAHALDELTTDVERGRFDRELVRRFVDVAGNGQLSPMTAP